LARGTLPKLREERESKAAKLAEARCVITLDGGIKPLIALCAQRERYKGNGAPLAGTRRERRIFCEGSR
jgi:hypothetical protein